MSARICGFRVPVHLRVSQMKPCCAHAGRDRALAGWHWRHILCSTVWKSHIQKCQNCEIWLWTHHWRSLCAVLFSQVVSWLQSEVAGCEVGGGVSNSELEYNLKVKGTLKYITMMQFYSILSFLIAWKKVMQEPYNLLNSIQSSFFDRHKQKYSNFVSFFRRNDAALAWAVHCNVWFASSIISLKHFHRKHT